MSGSFLSKDDLKRKGEEILQKIEKQYNFFSNLEGESGDVKPLKKGDIPRLAVLLGLLDPFFFDLYQMCQGKSVAEISEVIGLKVEDTKILLDKLIKNGLVEDPEKRKEETKSFPVKKVHFQD